MDRVDAGLDRALGHMREARELLKEIMDSGDVSAFSSVGESVWLAHQNVAIACGHAAGAIEGRQVPTIGG